VDQHADVLDVDAPEAGERRLRGVARIGQRIARHDRPQRDRPLLGVEDGDIEPFLFEEPLGLSDVQRQIHQDLRCGCMGDPDERVGTARYPHLRLEKHERSRGPGRAQELPPIDSPRRHHRILLSTDDRIPELPGCSYAIPRIRSSPAQATAYRSRETTR